MYRCERKTLLFVYTCFSFALCFLNCDAYQGLIPANAEHPGVCVYRGDILKAGEIATKAPTCQQLQCNEDGSILVTGCGRVRLAHCNRGERLNMDKPYPSCCVFKYKCKESDGTPYYIEKDVSQIATK